MLNDDPLDHTVHYSLFSLEFKHDSSETSL